MNLLPSGSGAWLRDLLSRLGEGAATDGPQLLVCAPYTHLPALTEAAFGSAVKVGAQDVSAHESGAYTGEVSASMLADLGVSHVIVGHSERRHHHREDDATVAAKARRALAHGLTPIVCLGEDRTERDAGRAEEVVLSQLQGSLEGVEPGGEESIVIAYEPVWAIGTGLTATAGDAQAMGATIRRALEERYPAFGTEIRVLYGGSMNPGNAGELLAEPDVDGGLIGGASLKVDDFLAIRAAGEQR